MKTVIKNAIILMFVLCGFASIAQTNDNTNVMKENKSDTVTFITTFDIKNATKDGFYINGYVVDIDYQKATEINGKKIRISGKVMIVKGLKNQANEKDENGNYIAVQGRLEDTKHIKNPIIEIMK